MLSEKPVAKDIANARNLLDWYDAQPSAPLWGVAENFRFIKSVEYAANEIRSIGGQLTTFRLTQNNFVTKDNKYFNTECTCLVDVASRSIRSLTATQGERFLNIKEGLSWMQVCTSWQPPAPP